MKDQLGIVTRPVLTLPTTRQDESLAIHTKPIEQTEITLSQYSIKVGQQSFLFTYYKPTDAGTNQKTGLRLSLWQEIAEKMKNIHHRIQEEYITTHSNPQLINNFELSKLSINFETKEIDYHVALKNQGLPETEVDKMKSSILQNKTLPQNTIFNEGFYEKLRKTTQYFKALGKVETKSQPYSKPSSLASRTEAEKISNALNKEAITRIRGNNWLDQREVLAYLEYLKTQYNTMDKPPEFEFGKNPSQIINTIYLENDIPLIKTIITTLLDNTNTNPPHYFAIPILREDHYVLIFMDTQENTIEYYNPFGVKSSPDKYDKQVMDQIQGFLNSHNTWESKIFGQEHTHNTHQTDGRNCGPYILHYAQQRLAGKSADEIFKTHIPASTITKTRAKIAKHLETYWAQGSEQV